MPGSDTGAIEMAMWSLLGSRGVDFLSWDNFGALWAIDGERQLSPLDARVIEAPYGCLPDLAQADPARDTVFVWNGTTSGVRVPDAAWSLVILHMGLVALDAAPPPRRAALAAIRSAIRIRGNGGIHRI